MSRAAAAAVVVAATLTALAGCGGDDDSARGGGEDSRTGLRIAPGSGSGSPFSRRAPAGPPAVIPGRGSLTAYVSRASVLRSRPGGPVLSRLARQTRFKSPRVLHVVARRGAWLGVLAPELRNGQVGWLDASRNTELFRVPYSVEASLSRRVVTVRRLGRVVVSMPVAIGSPSTPTPRGTFAVTDKLLTENPATNPYGCCILALTGHQPQLSQGWGGGDRLAIHATNSPQTIGEATSKGCLRAASPIMRRLVKQVPLGTPVVFR